MKFGDSSSFIDDATEYIKENNKPINLTFRSEGMSNYISGITDFISIKDNSNGNQFWRFKNIGGNDSFYCFNSSVPQKSIYDVNLRNILNKAKSEKLFKSDSVNNTKDVKPFYCKIYASHYSVFFFNSYQRDGYILKVDEEKDYRLNENSGDMEIYMTDIMKNTDFYYYFYPDSKSYVPSMGYKGIGVKVVEKNDIQKDIMMLL